MPIVALIVFVAAVLVATRLIKRSLGALTADEKVRLVDAAAKTSPHWFLMFLALVVAWLTVLFLRRDLVREMSAAMLVAFLVLSILSTTATLRRYRAHGLPPSFLRTYRIAYSMRLASAVFLFASVGAQLFRV